MEDDDDSRPSVLTGRGEEEEESLPEVEKEKLNRVPEAKKRRGVKRTESEPVEQSPQDDQAADGALDRGNGDEGGRREWQRCRRERGEGRGKVVLGLAQD